MTDFAKIGAAVIGTGFIGTVHTQALLRLGVQVRGVLGSSAARGAQRAAEMGVPKAYGDLAELLADDTVDVVHVTSPNHAHYAQVLAILRAGKHVICEKPLAMTSEESADMVAVARASGKVAAVCYNIRFYPLNQQAHGMVAAGDLGDIRFISGHYHQDWLAKPTDWNWRLVAEEGGALRSVGDIGTHWVDLTSFVTGLKAEAVMAELATFIPERARPTGPVETFSAAAGATQAVPIATDDAAMIVIRYANGARGVMSTSQINMGRKNSLQWDVAGSAASAAWDSETPDHLFIGHRDRANETLMRDFTLMNAAGTAAATLPPGHVEGFADSFFNFFKAVYADVEVGSRQDGSTWATFEDGHYEMRFCDAVVMSAREERWVRLDEVGG
ncbi:Gfo/Idh/MocA family oxidoreductase [Rhodobacteraceae bacterium N5(2021)]|uniref:Gfo/Idh/MocA family oxidoreductase n=1 Tax=Gymnodinialimonas phycosphaerae TaxID=2841589 RepID=A0A975YG47_9RHOB|nr:Gfo/Idh/MocA family oxidoreductase [Gymnodinialimonas phycosphaerae]MBY4891320.1 Gfo/Idh/MocA family oxidoreductase [Gymnodinialimonas phycosphaerae]